jgi:hypothetical protein
LADREEVVSRAAQQEEPRKKAWHHGAETEEHAA